MARTPREVILSVVALIISQIEFVIAWLNRAFSGKIGKRFGLNPELVEETDADVNRGSQPKTTDELLENIKDSFQKPGSVNSRFFKENPKFFEELATKAISFAENLDAPMDSEDLAKMVQVTLHQQVIYCDDSTSMKHEKTETNPEGRWGSQAMMIERIARITTRILPEGEGTHLRYINQDINNADNLLLQDLPGILENIRPIGRFTPVGTGLKSKILEPLVYSRLPKDLKRPLLISLITDGSPSGEAASTLVDNIIECGDKLQEANLPRSSVKFLLGQVGQNKKAEEFLEGFRNNQKVKEVVFVVSEKLDNPQNMGDELKIDKWLINTLYAPIIQAENFLAEAEEEEE